MKQLDALSRFETVQLSAQAANEASHPAGAAAAVEPALRPGGWDPFEVWRTRVRDARRDPDDPAGG